MTVWMLVCLALDVLAASPGAGLAKPSVPQAAPGVSAVEQVNVLLEAERLADAEDLARSLLARAERISGPHSLPVADALDALALALTKNSKNNEARRRSERAVRLKESILGAQHREVAFSLDNLVHIIQQKEDWPAGAEAARRAVSIREGLPEGDSVQLARSLMNLALFEWKLGDFAAARRDYERALKIFDSNGGAPRPHRGILFINMSLLLRDLGDFEAARALLERLVVDAGEQPMAKKAGTKYYSLCHLLRLMGDYESARLNCERCLAIWEVDPGPDSGEMAGALEAMAQLLIATGDSAAARPMIERAIAIRRQPHRARRHELTSILSLYGGVLAASGDLAGARAHLEEGLAIMENNLPPDHPEFIRARTDLGTVSWRLGDFPTAWDNAFRAAAIGRKTLRATAAGLPEREAIRYETTRLSSMDLLVSLLLFSDRERIPRDAAGLVLNEEIRSRAIVLDEIAGRHRWVSKEESGDVPNLMRAVVKARNRRSRLLVSGAGEMTPERYREQLSKSEQDMNRAERDLAARSAAFRRHVQREKIDLEEVAASLPGRSALVAYVKFNRVFNDTNVAPVPSYMAFVLSAGAAGPAAIPLGSADAIDALVMRWRDRAGSNPVKDAVAAEREYLETAAPLRERIWDPIAAGLPDREIIFVVPDGMLNVVSFATLPHREGGYLIEREPALHYLSAERDLVRYVPARPPAKTLLALGGVDFDGAARQVASALPVEGRSDSPGPIYRSPAPRCSKLQDLRFDPLSSSLEEVQEIESLWSRNGRAVALTGPLAAEQALKRNASEFEVLHVATHGFFMQESCDSGKGGSKPFDSPLLLSGLALAGANARHALTTDSLEEDGILTAEEISTLDLSGVDWAVLSACGTGLGTVLNGEGVLGLRRAFEVAGVGTIVMSLWNVEDVATRIWMRGLYEARLEGAPTVAAVRAAGLRMIERRRQSGRDTHPFYWGGFVAAGDWR